MSGELSSAGKFLTKYVSCFMFHVSEVEPDQTPPLPKFSYDWIDVASPNPPTYVKRIGR